MGEINPINKENIIFKPNKNSTIEVKPKAINIVGKNKFPSKDSISNFNGNLIINPITTETITEIT